MKKIAFLIVLMIGFIFQSCKDDNGNNDDPEENPVEEPEEYDLPAPEITISNPVPCLKDTVVFSYKSDVAATPEWTFDDGTTSTDDSVKHIYTQEGDLNVNLKLSDGNGGTVSVDTTVSVMGMRLNDALTDLLNDSSEKWICAHRGNTYRGIRLADIPENSTGAIEQAIEIGVEMVEIDVRTTFDSVLVILHNETIDEATNGTGAVAEMSLARLKSFYLLDPDGDVSTYKIPTLEEALLAGRGKVFFDLDLKDIDPKAVVELVDSLHMLDRVAFYRGSSKSKAAEITDVNSQAIVFPYVKNTTVIDYWSEDPRIKMVQLDYTASTAGDIVTAATAKGLASFANYLNDPGEAVLHGDYSALDSIVELGFHIIQTDYAEYVTAHLEQ